MSRYTLTVYVKPGRPFRVLVYDDITNAILIGRVFVRLHQFMWRITNADGITLAWSKDLYSKPE